MGASCPAESFDAFFGEALLPAPHRGAAHADALCDLQHGQALVGAEDDARPLDVLVRTVPVGDESHEALTFTGVEEDARGLGHAPRLAHLRRTVNPQIASVRKGFGQSSSPPVLAGLFGVTASGGTGWVTGP